MIRLSADQQDREMPLLNMEANSFPREQDINDPNLSGLDDRQADLPTHLVGSRKEATSSIDRSSLDRQAGLPDRQAGHDSSIIDLHSSKLSQLHHKLKSHQEYTRPLRLLRIWSKKSRYTSMTR